MKSEAMVFRVHKEWAHPPIKFILEQRWAVGPCWSPPDIVWGLDLIMSLASRRC